MTEREWVEEMAERLRLTLRSAEPFLEIKTGLEVAYGHEILSYGDPSVAKAISFETASQRRNRRLIGDGEGIHWPTSTRMRSGGPDCWWCIGREAGPAAREAMCSPMRAWDAQLAADVQRGKLDDLADEALGEHVQRKTTPL